MNSRYYSLDVFRGATVCLMILVNNPGTWSHIFGPLKHANWHGCTPTDLVFPFFLFAVGNALSFVMPRLQAGGDAAFWKKVIKRTLLIFGIGLFLNWLPFVTEVNRVVAGQTDFVKETIFKSFTWTDLTRNKAGEVIEVVNGVRIMGVLQRIALCYFFASLIVYYLKPRLAFFVGLLILLLYWVLCYAGNPADPYSLAGWFGTDIDKALFGKTHLYKGEGVPFDPEGLVSTLPAIVQVLFGYFTGDYIQKKGKSWEMLSNLFVAGAVLIFTGFCWDMMFPINKKIWTSSYVIYTTGLALMTIGLLIYLVEFREVKGRWSRFFDVFGKNPLFVFALSAFLPKTLGLIHLYSYPGANGKPVYVTPWSWPYRDVFRLVPGIPETGSLLFALFVITLMWAVCYWLDKRKIYIRV